MVSQEIRTNAMALGALFHEVSDEQAAMLRLIRTNLVAAADAAEELEQTLTVPVFRSSCGPDCRVCAAGPNTFK